jgi:hypothetical protein
MGTDLCLEAMERALRATGKIPEIFNTDKAANSPRRSGQVA